MQKEKRRGIRDIDVGFLICLLFMFLVTLVMTKVEVGKEYADFRIHSRWAVGRPMEAEFDKFYFYPVWHFCVKVVYQLTPLGREWAAALVTACFVGITGGLLYLFVRKEMKEQWSQGKCILLTLALSFVMALYMPWFNKEVYLGQSSPTIWHNPTNLAVKPLALFLFLCFVKLYRERETAGKGSFVIISFLLLLSCFVKPSFIQGFLPAIALFLLLELIPNKGKTFWFSVKVGLAFVPAALYFVAQYLLLFDSSGTRKIGIQPFAVMRLDSPNPLFSLLLGIAFPLFVILALGGKRVFADKALWLSILFYLVSLVEFILFIEETEAESGNFEWAMQLAMFTLFIMTALRFYQTRWKQTWVRLVGNFLLFYHVLSGIWYYIWLLVFTPLQC